MNYLELKESVAQVIKTNGEEEITGEVLQYILLQMIDSLGKNYQFAGVATPLTDVGTPDENKAWILGSGSYENFGTAFEVAENEFAVAMYNGVFTVRKIAIGQHFTQEEKTKLAGLPTDEELEQMLSQKQDTLEFDNEPTSESENPVTSAGIHEAIKNFITKAVDDLLNYYKKSETYTRTEIENLINGIDLSPYATIEGMGEAITEALSDYFDKTEVESLVTDAISQALTAYYSKSEINTLLDAFNGRMAALSLESDKDVVLTDAATQLTLTARIGATATSINIKRNDVVIASGSGTLLQGNYILDESDATDIVFDVVAVIGGVERTEHVTVKVVDAVLYGAGTQAKDITTKATARLTPAGLYNIAAASGDKFFILVPVGMTVNGLRMNGIDIPMDAPTGVFVNDVQYLCYASSNVYDTGSYLIEVY